MSKSLPFGLFCPEVAAASKLSECHRSGKRDAKSQPLLPTLLVPFDPLDESETVATVDASVDVDDATALVADDPIRGSIL